MSKLIVVSNRIAPISEGKPTAGGLAVGVFDALKQAGGIWFGWNGDIDETGDTPRQTRLQESENITYATTSLSRRDYDEYYRGFANSTLWPVFHYRPDLSRYDRAQYQGYRRVNDDWARQVCALAQDDDAIWVHDYHLLPFAQACRNLGARQRIGFFLHIPFPAEQILATVPPHRELITALCAYDVIGFQTERDRRAFSDYVCLHLGATRLDAQRLSVGGREVLTGSYPIGIYPEEIEALSHDEQHTQKLKRFTQAFSRKQLIISVDRLDYSKGLIERFTAFDRLMGRLNPHNDNVAFVQIAPPSREDVEQYRHIRRQLESLAGRINGRWSDLASTPLHYINKAYDRNLLMALFRASQVGFVTPLRDGMNLVAKEYVAAQPEDNPGVLVLSEFAGAAEELAIGALLVNPYDLDHMAETLERALAMPRDERQARHQAMMLCLKANNLSQWRDRFLHDLGIRIGVAEAA